MLLQFCFFYYSLLIFAAPCNFFYAQFLIICLCRVVLFWWLQIDFSYEFVINRYHIVKIQNAYEFFPVKYPCKINVIFFDFYAFLLRNPMECNTYVHRKLLWFRQRGGCFCESAEKQTVRGYQPCASHVHISYTWSTNLIYPNKKSRISKLNGFLGSTWRQDSPLLKFLLTVGVTAFIDSTLGRTHHYKNYKIEQSWSQVSGKTETFTLA